MSRVEDLGALAAKLYEDPSNFDPRPLYSAMRDEAPLLSTPLGFAIATRYDDVVQIYKGGRTARTPPAAATPGSPIERLTRDFFTSVDPQVHRRMRTTVQRAFTPAAAQRVAPQLQHTVDRRISQAKADGGIEVVADLAQILPGEALGILLGIPSEDRSQIAQWAIDVLDGYLPSSVAGMEERADTSAALLNSYIDELIEERRAHPAMDLLSELLDSAGSEEGLSVAEIRGVCGHLLVAGTDSTVAMIANAVFLLLSNKESFAALTDRPALADSALAECLRFDPPVRSTPTRVALEDIRLSSGVLDKGQIVTAWLGAANLDPNAFLDPDRFDIARTPNRHLTFSTGTNFCLGSNFARMEGSIALSSLARELPSLRLEVGWERRDTALIHGFSRLPASIA